MSSVVARPLPAVTFTVKPNNAHFSRQIYEEGYLSKADATAVVKQE
jgi:hypothetical protein